jgi:hypothetical protein
VVDKEQIKKEIQAKEDEFAATYNSGELKNIGYYADDATVFYQNRAPFVGKQAIVDFLKSDLIQIPINNHLQLKKFFHQMMGTRFWRLVILRWLILRMFPINSGNYMVMFQKRDGKYYSVREMSASDGATQ